MFPGAHGTGPGRTYASMADVEAMRRVPIFLISRSDSACALRGAVFEFMVKRLLGGAELAFSFLEKERTFIAIIPLYLLSIGCCVF